MTPPRPNRSWILPIAIVAIALVAAGCSGSPGGSGAVTPTPTALIPAKPSSDPMGLIAWAFTPIFQALFILLAFIYNMIGDVGIAIIVLTLIMRSLLVPAFRRQTVSTRRMQLLQPEIAEIQRRFKGDRAKVSEAQMALYKDRGVSPMAGCIPMLFTFVLLIPMYTVIRDGLTNFDPNGMLSVFGFQLFHVTCNNIANGVQDISRPCINTIVPWLGGLDVGKPSVLFTIPIPGFPIGISILALISSGLQLVQTRMMPMAASADNSQSKSTQQIMYLMPLITIYWGSIMPAGLFLYWIVTTLYAVIQQYLIVGWGSFFPLFGWNPSFARDHTPRFPVTLPHRSEGTPDAGRFAALDREASASATIRPRERGGRMGRRGRRR